MKNKLISRRFLFDRLSAIKAPLIIFGLIALVYNFMYSCALVAMVANEMPPEDVLGLLDYAVLNRYFVTVGLPIITAGAFAFVNERSATDFYMCLPIERRAMVYSAILASFIGGVTVILATSILSTVVVILGLRYGLLLDPLAIICELLALIVAAAMATAVTGMIASATGKRSMAIIASFALLAIPRVVMLMLNETLAVFDERLVLGHFFGFFDNTPNLFTAILFYNDDAVLNLTSYLYSAAIVAVALWFAGKYFKSRSGEHAGCDFAFGSVQGLVGVLFGMLLFVFGFIWICTMHAALIFFGGLLCVGGVVLVVIYATNGFKRLNRSALRAIPVFFITVALYVGTLAGGHFLLKSYSPGVDEIRSVSIVAEVESSYYLPMHYADYVLLRADGVGLTDSRSVGAVANALDFDDSSVNNSNINEYIRAVFKIEAAFSTEYRYLWMPVWEYEAILLASTDGETTGEVWLDMTSELIDANVDFGGVLVKGDAGKEALSILEAEMREVGVDRWYETVVGDGKEDVCYIDATVRHGGRLHYVYIPVPEYATRTLEYLEGEAARLMREEYDGMKASLEGALSGDGEEMVLYLYLSAEDGGEDYKEIYAFVSAGNEEAREIIEWLFTVIEPVYGDYDVDALTVEAYGDDLYSDLWFYQSYKLKSGVTREELIRFFAEHGE